MKVYITGRGDSLELRCPKSRMPRVVLRPDRAMLCVLRSQLPKVEIFDFGGLRITRGAREATIQLKG
jgi:hypothetical protein